MFTTTRPTHIAVIGGGFTGMVCALNLLLAGYQVTILEAQKELGGLTIPFDFGAFHWDKFYHCILTSDSALLSLLDDLGLQDQVRWQTTQVGLFSHNTFYTMTGPRDLLRYPHISFVNKLRLGLASFSLAHVKDGRHLNQVALIPWTRRQFGRQVSRELWEPLFRCKLGDMRFHASASFLWGTLRRLYSTRGKGPGKQEHLGYVHGGYQTVFESLLKAVRGLGATVQTGVRVQQVRSCAPSTKDIAQEVEITTANGVARFDGAIFTLPNPVLASCLQTSDEAYKARLAQVTYLGLVCVVLVLKRSLSPYYVTNIADESPFTGIIEMTNLIDRNAETAGLHLVYIPRYTSPGDALMSMSDEEVWDRFGIELQRMYPDLTESDIVQRFVFRERTVQPVPTLGYSEIAPPATTPCRGIYLANTAQIIDNTLNNNVMTTLANEACAQLIRDIPSQVPVRPTEPAALREQSPVLTGVLDLFTLFTTLELVLEHRPAMTLLGIAALLFVLASVIQRLANNRASADKTARMTAVIEGPTDEACRR